MRRIAALVVGASLAMPAFARDLHGRVYLDDDGDGRHDSGEPGIAEVKVSNGRDIVLTDSKGRYRIEVRDGDTVFAIKPPGYQPARLHDGVAQLWEHELAARRSALRYGGRSRHRVAGEFGLRRDAAPAELDVLVIADPQPKSSTDVGYYASDIIAPLQGRHRASLGLSLGDVVSDDLSLYPAMNAQTGRLGVPWLHIAGNHDIDFDAVDDAGSLETYRASYGPDTFAWEERNAVFIGLDDVIYQPGGRPSYVGGFRESQFRFLERYLAGLDRDRRIVLGVHIPFFDVGGVDTFRHADRERLFALLRPFSKVLLLSGHSHAQQHYYHGPAEGWHGVAPLHEYNVGAACGGYWSGVKDAAGIPDSTMTDGTPNGWASMRIDGAGDYSLAWHDARAVADVGMRLHAPKVLRRGEWPGAGLFANVFMGQADDRVEVRIDGGDWIAMRRVQELDPFVVAENLRDDDADELRGYDRMVQASQTTHLWRYNLPTDLAVGEHSYEVRTVDRWRGELVARGSYRLDDLQ